MSEQNEISVCMIVCDEEEYIVRALESVSRFFSEIIVVDTGSLDSTIEKAKKYTSSVHTFSWNNSFSDARNYSVSLATKPWILILDADEIIDESNASILFSDITRPFDAYKIQTRNYSCSTEHPGFFPNSNQSQFETGTGYFLSQKIRLFKNLPQIQFYGTIHECVDKSLDNSRITHSDAFIHHYGYMKNTRAQKKKESLYVRLTEKKCTEEPENYMAWFEAAMQFRAAGQNQKAYTLLKKCVEINPRFSRAWYNLGTLSPSTEEALYFYQKAIKLNPEYHEALFNQCKILDQTGHLLQAYTAVCRCLSLYRRPEYYNTAFILAIRLHKTTEAARLLSEGCELFPENENLKRNREIFIKQSAL